MRSQVQPQFVEIVHYMAYFDIYNFEKELNQQPILHALDCST
jgi:hypothetical protein